ncbi:alpha/beta hydrolase family protein [Fructobacillus parabroussonetiae]|uniref:S9 family peptidase n=1 Tax=Fructobacillus parabroussonetiae TaxID=2713174 RepID=A0ABS5QWX9_9LACO|nr:S9 family peptidase [Fructobacillus parabroussonetiae]MBS9337447.1 S9 family peptidase [Fructobacillus parabroussonetiae]
MPGIQIKDLYQLKSLSQPFATMGRTFVVENRMDEGKNDYQADIVAIKADGTARPYTNGGMNVQPIVAGNTLYYRHKDEKGHYQLMAMPVDGGSAQALTSGNGSVDEMHFSPDQTTLFFKVCQSPSPEEAADEALTPRHLTQVQNKADGIGWLPTENVYELASYDIQTGKQEILKSFNHDFHLQDVASDNTSFAYLAPAHPDWTEQFDDTQAVFIYDTKSEETSYITVSIPEGIFTDASFSPDGQQMVLIGSDYHAYSATINQVYRYDFASKELSKPVQDDQINIGYGNSIAEDWTQQPAHVSGYWINKNTYIYTAIHKGNSQFYLYDAKTQTTKKVHEAARNIIDFAMKNEKTVIFVHSTAEKAAELHELNLETGDEQVLYNPNAQYEESHDYASTESFYYPTTDGKTEIQGWFTKAQTEADKAPIILYIHGGPHAAFANSFFQEYQALASEGFHVLYVNPRGSTSYGEDFAKDVLGHYGENDYADVMAGLDYALSHFQGIDSDKVFVAGGSYGGFLATWIIGHTNRFQAAIVQRPAIDWFNLYHNSDIGVSFTSHELGADLYKDKAFKLYWEKSPIAYADRINTPVRIQHGEEDRRCPVSQSEALFTAVKRTGTDCDYIRYPQSFHGLSRNGKPSLRVRRIEDIVNWFKRY